MAEAFIVDAVRTAGARKGGRLSGWHPADLAAQVLDAIVERTGVDPAAIEDVIMGCVGQAGEQSNNIARNAVLASRLPESVPGTSIDRQCGSSQQALHFAAQAVMSGSMDIVIAAGVESMTHVPMGLPATLAFKHGFGSYMSPAMQARYPNVQFSQFAGAEMLAVKYDLAREELDEYALRSHRRASVASQVGHFDAEILKLPQRTAEGEATDRHSRHRRRDSLRRHPRRHRRSQAVARGRAAYRSNREPDLRRRRRAAGRERTRIEDARRVGQATGANPSDDGAWA